MPEATQLLRHGFAHGSAARPRRPPGWPRRRLARARELRRRAAPRDRGAPVHRGDLAGRPRASASRCGSLCHDRGSPTRSARTPTPSARGGRLDDATSRSRAGASSSRYALVTDHDQDQLRVWQLFDPALIDWLTEKAPARLLVRAPGRGAVLLRPGRRRPIRTARCALRWRRPGPRPRARARRDAARSTAGERDRADRDHRGASSPRIRSRAAASVWAAAQEFGWWGLVTGRSWRLGAEAFFRAYAAGQGFTRIERRPFRAGAHRHPDARRDHPDRRRPARPGDGPPAGSC